MINILIKGCNTHHNFPLSYYNPILHHSLDWRYVENPDYLSIDTYETSRAGSRRTQTEMKMPPRVRHDILMDNWDVPIYSILKASQATKSARDKRLQTARMAYREMRKKERMKSLYKRITSIFRRSRRSRRGEETKDTWKHLNEYILMHLPTICTHTNIPSNTRATETIRTFRHNHSITILYCTCTTMPTRN